MERYDKPLEQTTRFDGARVYKTCRPSNINATAQDIIVAAGEQDRFDVISSKVFGSIKDWWKVASINKSVNGSLHVKPGSDLIIPSDNV